jgi:hypothetical protein
MKLFDLEDKKFASKALKESFDYSFNPSKLNKVQTQTMITKVKKALAETRKSPTFYKQQNNASYLKLVFMEEALRDHYIELNKIRPRLVVENEEVEKSQVILAAQDMVDSIQKMLEDVGQMQVKELPALVSSIESEMDVQKAQEFNDSVGQQLTTLSEALKASFDGVKGSLNSLTGMEGAAAMSFDTGAEEAGDLAMDAGAEMGSDMGAEMGADMEAPMPPEEPETTPTGGVGRAKR